VLHGRDTIGSLPCSRPVIDHSLCLAHRGLCQHHSDFPTPTARPSLPLRDDHVEVCNTWSLSPHSPRVSRVRAAVCPPWSPSRNLTSETQLPKCRPRREPSLLLPLHLGRSRRTEGQFGVCQWPRRLAGHGCGRAGSNRWSRRAGQPRRSCGRAAKHIRVALDLLSCFCRDKSDIGVRTLRTRELMCASPTVGRDMFHIWGIQAEARRKHPNRCRDHPRFAKLRQQGARKTIRQFHHKK
jgi:hypothetical protein